MNNNVGSVDRLVRVVVGIAMVAAGVYYRSWWGAVGAVPLLTAAVGSCPVYSLLGLSTCPVKRAAARN